MNRSCIPLQEPCSSTQSRRLVKLAAKNFLSRYFAPRAKVFYFPCIEMSNWLLSSGNLSRENYPLDSNRWKTFRQALV